MMCELRKDEPVLSNTLHPRTDVGNQSAADHTRKLKMLKARKGPAANFFMNVPGYCLRETGRNAAP
jgi:hypothetical protein